MGAPWYLIEENCQSCAVLCGYFEVLHTDLKFQLVFFFCCFLPHNWFLLPSPSFVCWNEFYLLKFITLTSRSLTSFIFSLVSCFSITYPYSALDFLNPVATQMEELGAKDKLEFLCNSPSMNIHVAAHEILEKLVIIHGCLVTGQLKLRNERKNDFWMLKRKLFNFLDTSTHATKTKWLLSWRSPCHLTRGRW